MKIEIIVTSDEIDDRVNAALIEPEDYEGNDIESLNEQRGSYREGFIDALKYIKTKFEEHPLKIKLIHPKR